jgi:hypothetical protein
MLRSPRALVALAAGVVFVAGGCGKTAPPAVDAEKERAQATERAKQRAYGGDAMKALEAAKALEGDLNKKAQESVEKAEK